MRFEDMDDIKINAMTASLYTKSAEEFHMCFCIMKNLQDYLFAVKWFSDHLDQNSFQIDD